MLEPCVGVSCACIPLMRPLLSRAFPERLSKKANKYGEFKDPGRSPGDSDGSGKRRFGSSKKHDEGIYPLRSTSGSLGVTTNEISSGRLAEPHDGDKDSHTDEFVLGDLEAQRLHGSQSPRDGINVKKEWRVSHL